jgi:hypothetical protein
MTPKTVWQEHRAPYLIRRESNVVKVTDYSYENRNRYLTLSLPQYPVNQIIEVVYRRHPNFNNLILGDKLFIGTKKGKGVEVGEIKEIEKGVDNIVITVEEASEEDPWHEDFIQWIRKPGQELFVFSQDELNIRERRLGVELSLARYAPEPDPNPPFTNVPNFHKALDGDGDGTITEPETNDFVSETRRRIDEDGLTFAELAGKIPPILKVNNIEVDSWGWGGCTTQFNGVPAKVQLVGGTSFVYIPANILPGVSMNTYGDVDRTRFEELVQDYDIFRWAQRIGVPEFSDSLNVLPNALPQDPWPTPNRYMSVIDKKGESVVVNGEKIASIRKVKKCGKCYYKIEIEDSGFVPSIKTGYLKECLLTIREGGKPSMHA